MGNSYSYAPYVFQALAQDKQRRLEEDRIRQAGTPNLGSILAGMGTGGLSAGGDNWLQGLLMGGLQGASSSEAEGGVGIAKGALGGMQQGQALKDRMLADMQKQELQKSIENSNLSPEIKAIAMQYPELYAKSQLPAAKSPSILELLILQAFPQLKKQMGMGGVGLNSGVEDLGEMDL